MVLVSAAELTRKSNLAVDEHQPGTACNDMQAAETNESKAESEVTFGGDIVEAMARLQAFVLANESRQVILPRCTQSRARLESSMDTEGEAVSKQLEQRSACRCIYNKVVGISVNDPLE